MYLVVWTNLIHPRLNTCDCKEDYEATAMAPILPTDEKSVHRDHDPPSMPSPASSRFRPVLTTLLILAIVLHLGKYFGFSIIAAVHPTSGASNPHYLSLLNSQTDSRMNQTELVPLEVHIMSKCPDARDCLRDLIVPTMERVSDKVDLTLSFIGRWVGLNESALVPPPL